MKLGCSQHVSNNIQIAYVWFFILYCKKKKSHAGKNNLKVLRYLQVAPNPLLDQQSYPTQLMRKSSTLTSEFKV